jgi:hypothetical protein
VINKIFEWFRIYFIKTIKAVSVQENYQNICLAFAQELQFGYGITDSKMLNYVECCTTWFNDIFKGKINVKDTPISDILYCGCI